jgi:hypothetical protein
VLFVLAIILGPSCAGQGDAAPQADAGSAVDGGVARDAASADVASADDGGSCSAGVTSSGAVIPTRELPDPLPPQPLAGEIACGEELMCSAGELCCAGLAWVPAPKSPPTLQYAVYLGCSTGTESCASSGADSVVYCDGPEDCAQGQQCCGYSTAVIAHWGVANVSFYGLYQGVGPSWCASTCTCDAASLCHSDADCTDGMSCVDPAASIRLEAVNYGSANVWFLPYRICAAEACKSAAPSSDAGPATLPEDAARVRVSVGRGHACAITRGARLLCWGDDFLGQASPPAGTFVEVEAVGDRTCAIYASGAVACFGAPIGCTNPTPMGEFTGLAVAEHHACALGGDGELTCWGSDDFGESSPPAGPFAELAVGAGVSCAIRAGDGSAVCWGEASKSVELPGPWTSIDVDGELLCLVASDGRLRCGWSTAPTFEAPGPVAEISVCFDTQAVYWLDESGNAFSRTSTEPRPGPYRQISTGPAGTCAVRADGSIDCWGGPSAVLQVPIELR